MGDNYMTYAELKNVGVLVNFMDTYLNNDHDDTDPLAVGFEVKVYDSNGEVLGFVVRQNGNYVFIPGEHLDD